MKSIADRALEHAEQLAVRIGSRKIALTSTGVKDFFTQSLLRWNGLAARSSGDFLNVSANEDLLWSRAEQ